jgi:PhnB protein
MSNVKPIPDGFNTLTPYMVVDGAEKAIELYKKAFGAEVVNISKTPDGKVMNSQLRIGNSMMMLNDEFPEYGSVGPNKIGGSAVTVHIYTKDVDALWQQATAAGMEVTFPLQECFWGDRYGSLKDPFGHKWSMSTCIAEPTQAEMDAAAQEFFKE